MRCLRQCLVIFREKTVAIENRVFEPILIANQSYNKLRYWNLQTIEQRP